MTIGNPSPVALSSHPGTIVLTFCRNNQDVAVMNSTDNGVSWGDAIYVIRAQSDAFRKQLGTPANKTISHIATVRFGPDVHHHTPHSPPCHA
eukprot:COSAG01_NODE_10397_length_2176_cov_89.025518_2_plen_92_part_00